jgi:uncharacterized membrane protein
LLAGLIFVMRPQPLVMDASEGDIPTSAQVMPIIQQRCVGCHAQNPVQAGIPAPPLGIVLEDVQDLEAMALRVYQSVVVTRTMPLGNLSGMTEEERDLLTRWYAGLGEEME